MINQNQQSLFPLSGEIFSRNHNGYQEPQFWFLPFFAKAQTMKYMSKLVYQNIFNACHCMYMLKLPCTGFNLNKLLVNFRHGYSPILMRKLRRLPSHTMRHAFHVLYFSYLYRNTLNLKQKLMTSDIIVFAEFSFSLPFS